jgi:hypothetical protein
MPTYSFRLSPSEDSAGWERTFEFGTDEAACAWGHRLLQSQALIGLKEGSVMSIVRQDEAGHEPLGNLIWDTTRAQWEPRAG